MKTVKRKAEVGEKVLIVDPQTLMTSRRGEIYTIASRKDEDYVDLKELGLTVHDSEYAVIIEDEPAIPPHSSHYHQNGLDPLEVMRRTFPPEQYEGFLRGSLLKYTMRYDRKGQQQADLEKLNFYGRELEQWKTSLKDVNGNVIEAEDYEDA